MAIVLFFIISNGENFYSENVKKKEELENEVYIACFPIDCLLLPFAYWFPFTCFYTSPNTDTAIHDIIPQWFFISEDVNDILKVVFVIIHGKGSVRR
jgi:hypothetical protein